jgi:hypothetical protein
LITGHESGANAPNVERVLGVGSYKTAWAWLHKFRRAMVRPGRERLSGVVDVEETYVGGRRRAGEDATGPHRWRQIASRARARKTSCGRGNEGDTPLAVFSASCPRSVVNFCS